MPDHPSHTGGPATETCTPEAKPRFCYACRRDHPPGHPMRRVETRNGYRWRCKASLDVARLDPATRDALGRAKSEANRLLARRAMEHFNRHRVQGLEG